MGFMACLEGGLNSCELDVCKADAGPVIIVLPLINESTWTTSLGESPDVLASGMPACSMASEVYISNGDEPGELGGVVSMIILGPSEALTGAPNVLINGIFSTASEETALLQNEDNGPGDYMVPSQVVVMVV